MSGDSYTLARRALLSALKRLDEGAGNLNAGTEGVESRFDKPSEPAVVVLVLEGVGPGAVATGSAADVPHPSHQRFALARPARSVPGATGPVSSVPGAVATGSASGNAPRPCFIEPNRSCIDSGCCESRGF